MNELLQQRIEEAAKKTACPQCVFNDGGTCNNDDDCKLLDDFVGLMSFALQNQWISVKEALPEDKTKVFVIVKTPVGIVHRADYHINDYWYMSRYSPEEIVTHWMFIPSLKGDK